MVCKSCMNCLLHSPDSRYKHGGGYIISGYKLVGGYVNENLKLPHTILHVDHVGVVTELLGTVLSCKQLYSETSKQEQKEEEQKQSQDERSPSFYDVKDHSTHARDQADHSNRTKGSNRQQGSVFKKKDTTTMETDRHN